MRAFLACIVVVFLAIDCLGQLHFGSPNRDAFIGNLDGNPANFQSQHNSLDLFALSGVLTSNSASLTFADIFKLNSQVLRDDLIGLQGSVNGLAELDIRGPKVNKRVSKNTTIAVGTRLRALGTFLNLDGRLVNEIGETNKELHNFPYQIAPNERMAMLVVAHSEVNLSIASKIKQTANYSISVGASIRVLNGLASASLETNQLQGTIRLNTDSISYLTNATGQIATFSSGSLLDDVNLTNIFAPRKISIASDLGFSISYGLSKFAPYRFRIGASLLDLGTLRYESDTSLSKNYTLNIPATKGLYFNENFQTSSITRTSEVFDSHPEFFKNQQRRPGAQQIALPTTIRIESSYNFLEHYEVNATLQIPLKQSNTHALKNVFGVLLAPGLRRNNIHLFIPLAYHQYAPFLCGIGIRHKYFHVGSISLFSSIFGTRQMDLTAGVSLRL